MSSLLLVIASWSTALLRWLLPLIGFLASPAVPSPGGPPVAEAAEVPVGVNEGLWPLLGETDRALVERVLDEFPAAPPARKVELLRGVLAQTRNPHLRLFTNMRLGQTLREAGDSAAAAEAFAATATPLPGGLPGHPMARLEQAGALADAGATEAGLAVVRGLPGPGLGKVAGRDAVDGNFRRAAAYLSLGRPAEAVLSYLGNTPSTDRPEDVRQYVMLSAVLASNLEGADLPHAALKFRLNVLRRFPQAADPGNLLSAAELADRAGDPATANGLRESVLEVHPDGPGAADALQLLGRTAEAAGDPARAIELYTRAAAHPAAGAATRSAASSAAILLEAKTGPPRPDAPPLEPRPDPVGGDAGAADDDL